MTRPRRRPHHAAAAGPDTVAVARLCGADEMRFAEEISDRVVMFDSGSVVEQGPPSQIFKDPGRDRTRLFSRAVLEH